MPLKWNEVGPAFSFHLLVKSGISSTTKGAKISSPLSLVLHYPREEDSGPKSVSGQRAAGSLTLSHTDEIVGSSW